MPSHWSVRCRLWRGSKLLAMRLNNEFELACITTGPGSAYRGAMTVFDEALDQQVPAS